jgi:hypothetical protein
VTTAAAECRHADGEGESNGGGLERRGEEVAKLAKEGIQVALFRRPWVCQWP